MTGPETAPVTGSGPPASGPQPAPAPEAAPRSTWKRAALAAAGGAMLAVLAGAVITPLTFMGARGREAIASFKKDLEAVQRTPADLRPPPLVVAAAAAYEDRAFLNRPSWAPPMSPTGLARAIFRNLRGISEGGSTIPQQVGKLYLRGGRANALDKLGEALFATWLVRNATRDEIATLYLNLSAGNSIGARVPADGLHRLSLALFGLPLRRLSREDQLLLAGTPRGVQWLRAHPELATRRIAAAQKWLVSRNIWDARTRSYLDDGVDASAAFHFVDGFTERLASGVLPSADHDLVSAIDAFREGLGNALRSEFPGTAVRAAFAATGSNGAVLARSGAEASLMQVNYGSIAKLEVLDLAVEAFGPEAVRALPLPPQPCVRWIWATKEQRRAKPAGYCPTDVVKADKPMAFDEAVARSVNSLTVRHAALLMPLLWQKRPDVFREVAARVPAGERAALDSPADRALTAGLLTQLGEPVQPEQVDPALSYSAAGIALFRHLSARREAAGLPAKRLPEDPTSLLGNSSRATAETIGGYLHRKLFAGDGSCALSDTGALLAVHRREGTLRYLAARWPKLVFAGKTGSSPHDDAAVAAVAICLDGRPVVLTAALRPLEGTLPQGLRGSVLLRGLSAYLRELVRLERPPRSVVMPAWSDEGIAQIEAALAAEEALQAKAVAAEQAVQASAIQPATEGNP